MYTPPTSWVPTWEAEDDFWYEIGLTMSEDLPEENAVVGTVEERVGGDEGAGDGGVGDG